MEGTTVDGLVRLWIHEGLRLFQDRLVELEEREWTDKKIDEIAMKCPTLCFFTFLSWSYKVSDLIKIRYFPGIIESTLKRPILYSNWLSKDYVGVDRHELREYVKARLKVFYEEELDVPLVLFNEVLDRIFI